MSKKRILIVGVGSIGERHLRCFQTTNQAELGICELNDALRVEITDRYKVSESFSAVEQAGASQWDAAVIATPAHTHIPIAMQLAEHGTHLLIEKPLSVDLQGIEQLQSLVRERNLLCAVAYVYRAHPGITAMRKKIASGHIGKPLNLIIKSGQCFPFYRPGYRDTYYADRSRGGGAIQDAATHLFNIAEWLIGPIDRVCADAQHMCVQGVDVEDTAHVLARQNGAMTVITMNQFQPINETLIEVHGEGGSVQLSMHESCWRWADEPGGAWEAQAWGEMDRDAAFVTQAQAFLTALDRKNIPLCTLDEGIQTLRVNLAVLRSANESHAWEQVAS